MSRGAGLLPCGRNDSLAVEVKLAAVAGAQKAGTGVVHGAAQVRANGGEGFDLIAGPAHQPDAADDVVWMQVPGVAAGFANDDFLGNADLQFAEPGDRAETVLAGGPIAGVDEEGDGRHAEDGGKDGAQSVDASIREKCVVAWTRTRRAGYCVRESRIAISSYRETGGCQLGKGAWRGSNPGAPCNVTAPASPPSNYHRNAGWDYNSDCC